MQTSGVHRPYPRENYVYIQLIPESLSVQAVVKIDGMTSRQQTSYQALAIRYRPNKRALRTILFLISTVRLVPRSPFFCVCVDGSAFGTSALFFHAPYVLTL